MQELQGKVCVCVCLGVIIHGTGTVQRPLNHPTSQPSNRPGGPAGGAAAGALHREPQLAGAGALAAGAAAHRTPDGAVARVGFRVNKKKIYRIIALPSLLINYFGQKWIGKLLFLAENGSIKKYFRPKEAQTGLKLDKTNKMSQKRILKILFWPTRVD